MCGRGETTSPQGVANLMTADWLCMEHIHERRFIRARMALICVCVGAHLHRQWGSFRAACTTWTYSDESS